MKKEDKLFNILAICLVIAVIVLFIYLNRPTITPKVSNFEECVAAGYPVMESYPRQCRTPDGKIFVEEIPEETCAEEGEKVNRNPLMGPTDRQCCPGLVEDRVSRSYSICRRSTDITDSIYKCNKDDDCISVKSGCCGCTAGGSNIAINKDYLDYWNQKLSEECEEIGCPAVMSDHWTCFATPKCVNGECQLVE